jgi:hypothetical protein
VKRDDLSRIPVGGRGIIIVDQVRKGPAGRKREFSLGRKFLLGQKISKPSLGKNCLKSYSRLRPPCLFTFRCCQRLTPSPDWLFSNYPGGVNRHPGVELLGSGIS